MGDRGPGGAAALIAVLAAGGLLGCDALSALVDLGSRAAGAAAQQAAERPEGWESLEEESAALRLYYQFVDARGRVRFVERFEDVPEAWRERVGFVKLAVPPPLSPAEAARVRRASLGDTGSAAPAAAGSRRIVLYSAEWCGACRKAKRYLDRHGIAFELRDVDVPAVAEELVRKTGRRAVPVIDVDGRIMTGFSPSHYDELLGRA